MRRIKHSGGFVMVAAARFFGWLRPKGRPWRQVAHSADYRDAWRQVLAACARQGGDLEAYVNQGRHPEDRRKPR
jgi:hypothetical protein